MATIHPFRALRPSREHAPLVSSVPYDVVSTGEARQLVNGNPLSFLHVTRSEIDLPPGTDPYADEVYAKARENFATLRRQAPMLQDDTPSLYFCAAACSASGMGTAAARRVVDNFAISALRDSRKAARCADGMGSPGACRECVAMGLTKRPFFFNR